MNWNYIAGFFDGEGTVPMRFHGERGKSLLPTPSITQTGETGKVLLLEIQEFLHRSGIRSGVYCHVRNGKSAKPHFKTVNLLSISHRDSAVMFYRQILPHLRIKKLIVQDTLRFARMYPALRYFHNGVLYDGPVQTKSAIYQRAWRKANPEKYHAICNKSARKRRSESA